MSLSVQRKSPPRHRHNKKLLVSVYLPEVIPSKQNSKAGDENSLNLPVITIIIIPIPLIA